MMVAFNHVVKFAVRGTCLQNQPFDTLASSTYSAVGCGDATCYTHSCHDHSCYYRRSYAEQSSSRGNIIADVIHLGDPVGGARSILHQLRVPHTKSA